MSVNQALQDQVVVVTGGGRGIGRTIARRCAREGASVVVASRTEKELRDTVEAIEAREGRALAVPTDVTVPDDVDHLVEMTRSEMGSVDLLINNAGTLNSLGPLWEADIDQWCTDIRVNVVGVFLCCRRVLPAMIERGRGRIINMVGGGVTRPFRYGSAYGSSKAAVMRLTETVAVELEEADSPVRAFALSPGFVRTEMTEQFLQTEAGRKYMNRLAERLEESDDVPPEWAAEMVVAIGAGRLDNLHGRLLHSEWDIKHLDTLEKDGDDIVGRDARTLRVKQ